MEKWWCCEFPTRSGFTQKGLTEELTIRTQVGKGAGSGLLTATALRGLSKLARGPSRSLCTSSCGPIPLPNDASDYPERRLALASKRGKAKRREGCATYPGAAFAQLNS